MKKIILVLFLILTTSAVSAQTDAITKHSGEIVNGIVLRVDEYTIVFKYDGDDAVNSIGKYAIEKVVYGKSCRVKEITEKIKIIGEADWEKVII
jgi:sRNA-binding regulator protein Hfq